MSANNLVVLLTLSTLKSIKWVKSYAYKSERESKVGLKCHMFLVQKVSMTREWYIHRLQANPPPWGKHRPLTAQDNRLHFNEMFREILPEVGDLTLEGVCSFVYVYVCACGLACVCVNSSQQLFNPNLSPSPTSKHTHACVCVHLHIHENHIQPYQSAWHIKKKYRRVCLLFPAFILDFSNGDHGCCIQDTSRAQASGV